MTREQLFTILGHMEPNQKKKRRSYRWAALAACLVLVLGIVFWPRPEPQTPSADGPPSFQVDGVRYTVSSYVSVSRDCPEGYVYGGVSEFGDYYVNPEVPIWVYVYCEVRTTGEVDEHGTLIPAEPHMAYLRYVRSDIRGDDFVCCDGVLYRSMWSSTSYGDAPDLTHEEYEAIKDSYGIRIEGEAPAGFVYKGTAEFSGHDTIPTGTLSCNIGTPEIMLSEDGEILLASTVWYTAPGDDGEIEHHGWNVYVRVK